MAAIEMNDQNILSPISAFVAWFDSLPVRQRSEVAEVSVSFLPGYSGLRLDDADVVNRFRSKIVSYEKDRFYGVGAILGLRGLVQMMFINLRGTRAGWDKTRTEMKKMKAFFESRESENLVSLLDERLEESAFNEAQWIATAEKWDGLVRTHMSDAAIHAWWQSDLGL